MNELVRELVEIHMFVLREKYRQNIDNDGASWKYLLDFESFDRRSLDFICEAVLEKIEREEIKDD